MKGAHQLGRPRTTCSLSIVNEGEAISSAHFSEFSIERLQMAHDSYHVPVLEKEVVALFTGQPAGVVVDATLGGGGHALAILNSAPQLHLVGIDRDHEARTEAAKTLEKFATRVRITHGTFANLVEVLERHADFVSARPIVGVIMDLGVSSHQLDESRRGFSFRSEAPLDMRMDTTSGLTAAQLLAKLDQHEFVRLLRENGEDRFAGAIAKSVLARQPQTTSELTDAVERAVPMAARRRGHVATRVFQTLRILVNDETEQLREGLDAALNVVAVGGIVAVISYHSGEDRVVKAVFHDAATGGCRCPVELGCVCGAVARFTVQKASARLASAEEIRENPRARSARLRVAQKILP